PSHTPPARPPFPTRRSSDLARRAERPDDTDPRLAVRIVQGVRQVGDGDRWQRRIQPADGEREVAPDLRVAFRFLKRLHERRRQGDRKSTRLNSSHRTISYAV